MKTTSIAWTAAILLSLGRGALAATLFVAAEGSDANPGTEDKPFATLQRARDEIRSIKSRGPLPAGGITVQLDGGTYELAGPLELTDQDSGSEQAPIVYRASPGEVVDPVSIPHLELGKACGRWDWIVDPGLEPRMEHGWNTDH